MAVEILPGDNVQWMWGDAGFSNALAKADPLRWSYLKSPTDIASELEKHKSDERPVRLYIVRAGGAPKVYAEFKNVAEAIDALHKADNGPTMAGIDATPTMPEPQQDTQEPNGSSVGSGVQESKVGSGVQPQEPAGSSAAQESKVGSDVQPQKPAGSSAAQESKVGSSADGSEAQPTEPKVGSGAQPQEAKEADLKELRGMRLKALKEKAVALGCSGPDFDNADNTDDPKEALIQLITAKQEPAGSSAAQENKVGSSADGSEAQPMEPKVGSGAQPQEAKEPAGSSAAQEKVGSSADGSEAQPTEPKVGSSAQPQEAKEPAGSSAAQENKVGSSADGSEAQPAEPKVGSSAQPQEAKAETEVYKVIHENGVPVTASYARDSEVLQTVPKDGYVEVLQGETRDVDNRTRAPIHPTGWITLWMADGTHNFVEKAVSDAGPRRISLPRDLPPEPAAEKVTPKPTPHALPPGQSCGNLFVCGQMTDEIRKRLVDLKPQSMKASMPKFNLPADGSALPEGMHKYDIPCFGPVLTEVVTTLFNVDVVKEQADKLRFMLPRCSINEVIQKKNKERGPGLVNEIKLAGGDAAAVKKLEEFLEKIQSLAARDFVGADGKPRTDGKCWLDEFVPKGWEDRLHVDVLLTNFGFSEQFCREVNTRPLKPGSKDNWKDFAVRWLSKAFDIFSYEGSLSDVVNLIYAMLDKSSGGKPDIEDVVKTVKDFTEILKKNQWDKIVWKPTYLIHDSELDDMLTWLLCVTVGTHTGSNIYSAVQLPPSESSPGLLDHLQAQYESRSAPNTGVTVFRDPSSRNRDKVMYAACHIPPKFVYLVSGTEMRSFVGKYEWHQESNMFQSDQRRLYINPATGYWCISLDVKGMANGYYQIRALKKGCIPHTNLGWRMLVQAENNPENTSKDVSQQTWEEGNTKGRQAVWQDLTSQGEPILPSGQVKSVPAAEKPVFEFWISEDPRVHPESPPVCRHGRGNVEPYTRANPAPCRQEAAYDGWTTCCEHRRKSLRQNLNCPVYIAACKYLEELGVADFIDHKWDHCWCLSCHPADKNDTISDPANREQMCVVPRGWVAFGIVVSHHLREAGFKDIWKWPNTYHGTRGDLAQAILRHGHIGMPGDRMTDGSTLKSKNCAGRQDNCEFYTSPTAAYAGLQLYARPIRSTQMDGIVGQVVLQCNQNREPGNIKKEQGETMKFKANGFPPHGVCKQTPLYSSGSQAIEVKSERPDLCVIRRLLIRTFPENDPPTKSTPGDVKPIDGNYEQFRSPVDLKPGQSSGDGCLWL